MIEKFNSKLRKHKVPPVRLTDASIKLAEYLADPIQLGLFPTDLQKLITLPTRKLDTKTFAIKISMFIRSQILELIQKSRNKEALKKEKQHNITTKIKQKHKLTNYEHRERTKLNINYKHILPPVLNNNITKWIKQVQQYLGF